jgi:putative peptide zinc metalloprotease protein
MTAIAEPPVGSDALPSEAPLSHAEGLELLGEVHDSGYKEGISLVRRGDGQIVQLGPLMYGLLTCVDGRRDVEQLTDALCDCLGRCVETEHVERLAQKLAELGLLAGTEQNAPPRRNPLLALRWKYLVTDPVVTRRLTAPFAWLFRPWVLWPVIAAFLAVAWFVLAEKGIAAATAEAFHKPELLLLVFGLAVASAGFHEIGHASACRYGGATPGGMGVGIYMVWPAFYTDVTDAYRLPRRDRLRVDFGGLYFNALVAVATLAVWSVLRVDALLLLIGLQLLQMVKQLSPVIRADGYHILSDATGVPDLYGHIGPTLRRLLPGHRDEPSALTGRARFLVTAWVLIIVPILLSIAITAILVLPRLAATTWESGSHIASAIPDQVGGAHILDLLASLLRLVALTLPVLGTLLITQKVTRTGVSKAHAWSEGRPGRGAAVALAGAGIACALAWAWWPSGQYEPVRASDGGTLIDLGRAVVKPASAARPMVGGEAVQLRPGKHLAIAIIPQGGATKEHPAFFVIKGEEGQKPVVLVSHEAPTTGGVPAATSADTGSSQPPPSSTTSTPTSPAAPSTATSSPTQPVDVVALPFKLPSAPRPQDSQALAVNTTDGSIKYVVAYSLVEVKDGAPVDEQNSAYALASCNACTTVAVSFQLVLIVGTSNLIAPINFAGALNYNCPACVTTAIADQIVVTLSAQPSDELIQQLTEELQKLDELYALGSSGASPEEVAQEVQEVQEEIETDLTNSGLLANDPTSTSTSTGTTTSPSSSDTSTDSSTTPTETTPSSTDTSTQPSTTTDTTTTNTTTTDTTTTDTTTTDTSTQPSTTTTDTTTTDTTTTSSDTGTTTTPSG